MKLGRVIAKRHLTRGRGSRGGAVVEIGQPRKSKGRDEYYCPYRIAGVGDEKVRAAYGVDAVQAMQLASKAVAAELFRYPDLKWLGVHGSGFPPADESLPMEWARAIDMTSTASPAEPAAPPGLWPPLEWFASPARPVRSFVFTKVWLPRMWLRSEIFPARTDAVVHYGMPSPRHCEMLRAHARAIGTGMRFVGDLDPLDLAVFATLRTGGAPLRSRAAAAIPIAYFGIDDFWLGMCERRLGDRELRDVLIQQDQTERKLLVGLERAGLDVEALVGPRCAALLRDGLKLELEGATNAAFYGKDFMAELIRRLLRPLRKRDRRGDAARPQDCASRHVANANGDPHASAQSLRGRRSRVVVCGGSSRRGT